jgi:HD superfamily phosphodiesterase
LIVVSDALRRALEDDDDGRLRPLPQKARELLVRLDVPPRLAAHLRAVHDVAAQLLDWLAARHPGVTVDAATVLMGSALHDIGKVLHTGELSGPGSAHEAAGYELLRDHDVAEAVARIARDHATWQRDDVPLEALIVSLADKAWKDQRVVELEQLVVEHLAAATGEAPWAVFAELDEVLTTIGGDAPRRLAYQSRHRA